jgi:L,D-transpeptidase ErfK/SrfK
MGRMIDWLRAGRVRGGWIGPVVAWFLGLVWVSSVFAQQEARFSEEDFRRARRLFRPRVVVESTDLSATKSMIGSTRTYQVRQGDTFLDLARLYGLGYNEIEQANPGLDPWVPPINQTIVLPTEWVVPAAPYKGLIVNIPEMRLYYFHPKPKIGPQLVSTYAVGLGRDDWRTPRGEFRISGKTKNPTWVIPESILEERIREKGRHETFIAGGDPENPLGKYRLELTMPGYRIHGTNIPWGVGRQVSHGCVRLYPEDIEQLFQMVRVGDPGAFVYQPVKVGARGGRIFAEVHPDIYRLTPGPFREARRLLEEFGWTEQVDQRRLQRAVEEQSGVPLEITAYGGSPEQLPEEVLRPAMEPAPPVKIVPPS